MATKTIKYTVKKGDCLWNIAKTYLGSGTRWQEIAKLNGGGGHIGAAGFTVTNIQKK